MAQRHWVGGTNNWDASVGLNWALTNGGVGGQLVPTSSDDVFFDSGSGAVTCTLAISGVCKSIDFTGFTGTFAQGTNSLTVSGSMTFVSAMTYTGTGQLIMAANGTLTSNTKSLPTRVAINASVTMTLGDNMVTTNANSMFFAGNSAVIDANGKNLTCTAFDNNGVSSSQIKMGSGTWSLTGTGNIFDLGGTPTVTPSTSTLKITNTSNTQVILRCNGLTLNNIWCARGASTGDIRLDQTFTCNDFKDDGTAAHNSYWGNTGGGTWTFTTFHVSGTAGQLININGGAGNSNTFTFSAASGTISCDYLILQHSVATGGAAWYAGTHSTNNQAVATAGSGWIFTAPPTPSNGNFLMFMN